MNASRLLALFTVCFVIGIGAAALAVHVVAQPAPERHHIYWCYVAKPIEMHGERFVWTGSLPCMYRTNTPIAV